MIGVSLEPVRDANGALVSGARVRSVMPSGPAARAGVQAGDVITAVGGQPVKDPAQLTQFVESNGVGRAMALSLQRGGQQINLQVIPGELSSLMAR